MRFKAMLGGLAAATLAAQPLAAADVSRAAPTVEGESEMGGGVGLLGIAIFVAIVAAVYFIAESEDDPISA